MFFCRLHIAGSTASSSDNSQGADNRTALIPAIRALSRRHQVGSGLGRTDSGYLVHDLDPARDSTRSGTSATVLY